MEPSLIARFRLFFRDTKTRYGAIIWGVTVIWTLASWIIDNIGRVEFLVREGAMIRDAIPWLFNLLEHFAEHHWAVLLGKLLDSPIGPMAGGVLGAVLIAYGILTAGPGTLAAQTFAMADELTRFIHSQGATSPRPFNNKARIYKAMGYQLSNFPDEMIVEHYRSAFGDRMAKLLPQLRAAGATFHYQDDYYVSPSNFMIGSRLESLAVELREAATKLAASVSPRVAS
jgi:hypothetical protein